MISSCPKDSNLKSGNVTDYYRKKAAHRQSFLFQALEARKFQLVTLNPAAYFTGQFYTNEKFHRYIAALLLRCLCTG